MTNCSLRSNTGQWICQPCQQSRAQLLMHFSKVPLLWRLLQMLKLNIIVSNNTDLYIRVMLEPQVVNKQQTAFQFKVNISLIYLNLYHRRRSLLCVDWELRKEMRLHIAQTWSVPVTVVNGKLCGYQSIRSLEENSQINTSNDLIK